MSDIEYQENEDNNHEESEEHFKIEDIDDMQKSMVDSLEKTKSIVKENQNYTNYMSNDLVNIKNEDDNKEEKIYYNNNINDNNINENNINDNNIDDNNINNNINNINDNNINDTTNKEESKFVIESNILISTNSNLGFDNINENIKEGPINLIEFQRNNFILNPKALDILNSITEDLIIVSIVGKARTGKSYLMNLLLNNTQSRQPGEGFEISSKLNSCTKGIWLWDTPRQKPNSSAKIIFIDSEGTNSVDLSTKTYDSKIFALIVLISSLFIYNTNGNIDEKSIGDLALAAHLSNTVASNAIEDKDLLITELAPTFIWVLRDFVLDKIDPDTGEEITSDEYLELCLRNKSTGNKNKGSIENNLIRENIIKYFKNRECITLPRPVNKEEDLHKLNEIPFSGLKPNFREEFLNLKRKVYEDSRVKKIGNKKINGPILVGLLTSFINSLNSKIIPNINTAFDIIIINEIEKACENCINLWKENFIKIKEENPCLKDLYDIKYFVINEFNIVLNENNEIKHNNQYLEIFGNNKKKLENEIENDIQKIITLENNKKNLELNDILNKHKNINFYNDIKNELESNQKEFIIKSIRENNSKFINDIKNNYKKLDEEKALDPILSIDNEYNIISIKEILNVLNDDFENKINEINTQIKQDELYFKSYDIDEINKINNTLNQRYELLSQELDIKEKEIFGLIGKYTKLVETKDKILAKENNNGVPKRGDPNLTTLRSQKFQNGYCGITVETNEKGCGCELGEFCSIF